MKVRILTTGKGAVLDADKRETIRSVLDRSSIEYKPRRFYDPHMAYLTGREDHDGWLTLRYHVSVNMFDQCDLDSPVGEYAISNGDGDSRVALVFVSPIAFNI